MAAPREHLLRHKAAAVIVPRIMAITVAAPADFSESASASRKSCRFQVTSNHLRVKLGGGKRKEASSVVKAYSTMIRIGKCKKTSVLIAAMRKPNVELGSA